MISLITSKVRSFFNLGHERSLKLKRNIIYTFLIRGTSFLIGFILVPLTIHYVNPLQYGLWITISSLVAWMNTFDIGLSNGLRNNLAHSLAIDERTNIVKYVSTTYALLSLIALGIFIAFIVTGSFFNWNQLLNVKNAVDYNIWPIIIIALGAFCIQFSLQPISSILIATHQPFKSSLISLLGQMLTLVVIYILTLYTKGNLLTLVIVVTGAPVLMFFLANIYLFTTGLAQFAPKFKAIDFTVAKKLLNVGVVFFFIQIGALVLYETDNIVLTRVLGPGAVTTFNVGFKYFSLLTVSFSIIITPFWSAFTDAYAKNDMEWIRKSLKKMRRFWIVISVISLLLFLSANKFYELWVGKAIPVSRALSFSLAIYVMAQTWQVLHSYVLNGTGKLRVQLIMLITTSVINIPLSFFLVGKYGVPGTVIANILVMVIMDIVFTYQAELIINRKAKGIWDK
jgi:O-antigen/teichoic acid export membrane protein